MEQFSRISEGLGGIQVEDIKPVIFVLNEEVYGIDINSVNAIEQAQKVIHVPNAPEYIKGIINLRGEVIPVYNLRNKFRMEEKSVDVTKLIITKVKELLVAVEVDEVKEIHNIDKADIIDAPPIIIGNNTKYISKIAKLDDSMVIILDVEKLLSEEETLSVKQLAEGNN